MKCKLKSAKFKTFSIEFHIFMTLALNCSWMENPNTFMLCIVLSKLVTLNVVCRSSNAWFIRSKFCFNAHFGAKDASKVYKTWNRRWTVKTYLGTALYAYQPAIPRAPLDHLETKNIHIGEALSFKDHQQRNTLQFYVVIAYLYLTKGDTERMQSKVTSQRKKTAVVTETKYCTLAPLAREASGMSSLMLCCFGGTELLERRGRSGLICTSIYTVSHIASNAALTIAT